MQVFRSVSIGLLAACFVMLARIEFGTHTVREQLPEHRAEPQPLVPAGTTIMDLGPGAHSFDAMMIRLVGHLCHRCTVPLTRDFVGELKLAADERVVSVNEIGVAHDPWVSPRDAANLAIQAAEYGAGRFLDLTITSGTAMRRVLVLMH